MLQTSRCFSANLYVLASSVVGADSHIGPAKRTDFTVVFGKFVTPQQAERALPPMTKRVSAVRIFPCSVERRQLLFAVIAAVAVGATGGKGIFAHEVGRTAGIAHGVVQAAHSRCQVVQTQLLHQRTDAAAVKARLIAADCFWWKHDLLRN